MYSLQEFQLKAEIILSNRSKLKIMLNELNFGANQKQRQQSPMGDRPDKHRHGK